MEQKSRWYKQGTALLEEIKKSRPGEGTVELWYMGQHGFVISLGGLVFYIDMILDEQKNGEGKSVREFPPPFAPDAIQRVDYVLCTHNHGDHLNLETLVPLAKANPGARFVVPQPWQGVLSDGGIAKDRILGVRENEEISLGSTVKLLPVIAVHTPYIQEDPERDEKGVSTCMGFILKGEGLSIYHAGDTWIVPALVQSLKAAGPVNIALLPINGTDWERTAGYCIGNVSALDATKLARAIPADLTIPAHYDMFAGNSENPALFAAYMNKHCPEKRFHICALGERFIYRV
jgi:L-ascorbate metabolism protein UlaG (beta-lactamase superfamily)